MIGSLKDLRNGWRKLLKSPGFTITAMLMLALGICANSTVFSWINATMLHPIPGAKDTSGLVTIMRGAWNTAPSPPFSYPDYRDLRETNHSFSGILAYHSDWLTLTSGETSQRIYGTNTSWNYFDVLGVKPFMGRFFFPDEEAQEGGVPYVILSYSVWQTRFAADPAIIGKSTEIDRRPLTIIGVAPAGFIGCMTGIRTDVWLPLVAARQPAGSRSITEQRGNAWLNVMGRLRPGVTRQGATQELDTLMRQLVAGYPADHLGSNTITLDPLWRSPFGANYYLATSLPSMLAIAGVVLLLTCANIATLALVRFVSRRREIAIRQSLGAGPIELMRQMIFEGLLVSLCGGTVAILLTLLSARTLAGFIPPNASPIVLNGYVDKSVIAAILLLAVIASVICGALPAWKSSRVPTAEVLKEEAASVSSGSRHRLLLDGLVVGQIALSLSLLIAAGLFLRTLRNASDTDPGFDEAKVLLSSIELPSAGYSAADARVFQRELLAKLEAMPGVSSAALSDWVPLSFTRGSVDAFPEGYAPKPHESMEIRRASVSDGYFETVKIALLQGREFTWNDSEGAPLVAIVDETMTNRFWPRQFPLGKRMRIGDKWFTVIGVAKNTKHQRMNEPPESLVYFSLFQVPAFETIIHVRTKGDPYQFAARIERAVHELNSKLPVFDVRSLADSTQMGIMFEKIETTFAGAFALIALVLAASGIYGVVAYRTELRTHEIGIRIALGASRSNVLRLVLRQGMVLEVIGLAAGLALSLLFTQFLRGLLYGVSVRDPLTVISFTAILSFVAFAACYLPALKAMRIDPMTAIREQ